jgi:hypothetical protein
MDRERAALIRFRAGIDNLGRPVYLRKWLHICGTIGGTAVGASAQANTAELTSGQRSALVAYGNDIKAISVGSPAVGFDLISKNGRGISGDTVAHRFLEHHQLGDEWRGS